MNVRYRPEVDGLRALAVIPVVLFHAGFSWCAGGYVGVDVFFVISGYLITSIIVSEMERGVFTIAGFYERRARRILPALFVTAGAGAAVSLVLLMPNELRHFGQSLVAVSLFASNGYFWWRGDYFAPAADEMPLLHTWSLAVEEQFYLLYPIALVLLWPRGRRSLVTWTAVAAVASLAIADWLSREATALNFYLAPTRMWELMAGALVAWRHVAAPPARIGLTGEILALAGFLMIIASIVLYDQSTPFPSAWTLLPVAGTVLVLLCGRDGSLIAKSLSLRPLVWVGLISYSLYLWHYLLFALLRARSIDVPGAGQMWILIGVSVVLAAMTWRFVERPVRDRRFLTRRQIFAGAAAGSLLLAALGTLLHVNDGFPSRLGPEAMRYYQAKHDYSPRRRRCHAAQDRFLAPADACRWGRDGPEPSIAVWGDSHASVIMEALGERIDQDYGRSAIQFSYAVCPSIAHIVNRRFAAGGSCERFNDATLRYLLGNPQIDTVILLSKWSLYLEGPLSRFDRRFGRPEVFPRDWPGGGEADRQSAIARLMRDTVVTFLDAGKRVIVVYPIPELERSVPETLAKLARAGREATITLAHADYDRRHARAFAAFDALGERPGLSRAWPADALCDSGPDAQCRTVIDGEILYYDSSHLSRAGARRVVEPILELLTGSQE